MRTCHVTPCILHCAIKAADWKDCTVQPEGSVPFVGGHLRQRAPGGAGRTVTHVDVPSDTPVDVTAVPIRAAPSAASQVGRALAGMCFQMSGRRR